MSTLYTFGHVSPDCSCSGKRCSSCHQIQCIYQFCRNRAQRDGRHNHCKACTKATRIRKAKEVTAYQRSYRKQYMESHVEAERLRGLVKNANTKARRYHAPGTFTVEEWLEVKNRYHATCLRCGRKEPDVIITLDHVIPLSRGGSNSIENIQLLCRSCNTIKSQECIDYRPDRMRRERGA